mmetsp:Transcript_34752/g.55712  ORF Transcript_34752/g.55712 Transcript_34752/m.55712 type:complete len:543 (+) Transcript_34752:854-2482(+)
MEFTCLPKKKEVLIPGKDKCEKSVYEGETSREQSSLKRDDLTRASNNRGSETCQQVLGTQDVDCDDGTECIGPAEEQAFLKWLHKHGAKIDKIEWPSRKTVSGVRGAVAKQDIKTGEPCFEIPMELVICPHVCYDCPELSKVYRLNHNFFSRDDDLVIALFLMHEKLKGVKSFWHPYISILPRPGGIGDWEPEEQLLLQDRQIVGEARRRPGQMERMYKEILQILHASSPEQFPETLYSYDLFCWAWMSIQARAFGRRLPWTALVPFADLLNHVNVQTKYDLRMSDLGNVTQEQVETKQGNQEEEETQDLRQVDVRQDNKEEDETETLGPQQQIKQGIKGGENSTLGKIYFRLFPSGKNSYQKGHEVFNSYGRRSNRFLLLEYGFCLENNEWDTYELCVRLNSDAPNYSEKSNLLRRLGTSRVKIFRLRKGKMSQDLVKFCQIVCLSAKEISDLEEKTEEETFDYLCKALVGETQSSVYRFISSLITNEIEAQKTTLENDVALLATGANLPPRHMAAVLYRVGRKRILEWYKTTLAEQEEQA